VYTYCIDTIIIIYCIVYGKYPRVPSQGQIGRRRNAVALQDSASGQAQDNLHVQQL
jgi:hypothetical protein